ncbi:MAG: protein-export chaperone SecB [Lentimicrobiaceae bacterium]|nr:protein-export chaperone SecB [Lentimicrobiaceae bacterium]
MENKNKLDSGFRINDLILIESSFSRISNVAYGEGVDNNLDINTEIAVKDKVIMVTEEVTLVQKFQDIEQVKVKVKMAGLFECIGETVLTNFEEFGRVNGAAIIFPYIREHITNISLKAGIGALLLPPINFTKNQEK